MMFYGVIKESIKDQHYELKTYSQYFKYVGVWYIGMSCVYLLNLLIIIIMI